MTKIEKINHQINNYYKVDDRVLMGRAVSVISGMAAFGIVYATLHFLPGAWIIPVHLGLKELLFVSVSSGIITSTSGLICSSIYKKIKKGQITFKKLREALENCTVRDKPIVTATFRAMGDNNSQNQEPSFAEVSRFIDYLDRYYSYEMTDDEKNELKNTNFSNLDKQRQGELKAKESYQNTKEHVIEIIKSPFINEVQAWAKQEQKKEATQVIE